MYIKRISLWRIFIFTLAALAVSTVFAVTNHIKLKEYKTLSDATDRRAFAQLCEAVSSIDSELARSSYATDTPAQLFRISIEISRHSEAAKTALASLPTSELGLDRTSSFLTVTADYCSALALKSVSGTELSTEDLEGLKTLRESSAALSNELNSLYMLSDGKDFFADVKSNRGNEEAAVYFSDGMSFAEANMPESPVLIYDGPYSSHITQNTATFLDTAQREISVVEGLRLAADFLNHSDTGMKYVCRTDGNVQTYTYADTAETSYVSVTVMGGNIISYSQTAEVANTVLTGEDAVKIGSDFLSAKGYANMEASYHYTSNGICYVNYHHCDNGVTVYPDLIQLGIRLDTGETTFMNAYGYLWNNRPDRNLSPSISEKKAAEQINDEKPQYLGLCIIPSDGQNEILCHGPQRRRQHTGHQIRQIVHIQACITDHAEHHHHQGECGQDHKVTGLGCIQRHLQRRHPAA